MKNNKIIIKFNKIIINKFATTFQVLKKNYKYNKMIRRLIMIGFKIKNN